MFKKLLISLKHRINRNRKDFRPLIVVLSGISHATNIGDNSMLISLINDLKELEPKIRIVTLVENPDSCKNLENDLNVSLIKSLQSFISNYLNQKESKNNEATKIKELAQYIIKNKDNIMIGTDQELDVPLNYIPALKYLFLSDGVIDCGGACFTPKWKSWFYERCLYYLLSPKPLFSVGQGIDNFENPDDINLMKYALSKANLITLRENLSFEYLKSLDIVNINLTGDESLTLTSNSIDRLDNLLRPRGINILEPYIAFQFRYFVDYADQLYFDIVAKYIDITIRSLGINVLGVPMFYDKDCDERKHLSQIRARVHNKSLFKFPDIELNPSDVKGLFEYAQAAFGISYHSAVYSLSSGTPYIGLYKGEHYSQKMKGLAMLYDFPLLPHNIDCTTPNEFRDLIVHIYNDRTSIGINLKQKNYEFMSKVINTRKLFINQVIKKV